MAFLYVRLTLRLPFLQQEGSLPQFSLSCDDREMVRVLALVMHHDEQAVLTAVDLALESGVPSKLHILSLLVRLVESVPLAPITTQQDLVLRM